MTSAQGVDTSSYQSPLTVSTLKGLDFAFAKATNGLAPEDPAFASSWAAIGKAVIPRGAYHELTPADPVAQARCFMSAVTRHGLLPGDMLACVASDYDVTGPQAHAFLGEVSREAGPRCPVLLYSDLSRLPSLAVCTGYPLWIANFGSTAPASVAPWGRWMFWQYQAGGGADGGDRDAFNGTAAQLAAWVKSYADPTPPANWVFGPVRNLRVTNVGPHSVALSWHSPGIPMPLGVGWYQVVIQFGGEDVASYPRIDPKTANPQEWSGGSLTPGKRYAALVRAVATDGGHASPWASVAVETPAAP